MGQVPNFFVTEDDDLIEKGNIDLAKQPKVKNPQGGTSTVFSRGFNLDGKEVLLPSVTPDGRFLNTDDDVINEYKKTGRHLGKFKSVAGSNKYAEQLHRDYESGKYDVPDFFVGSKEPDKKKPGLLERIVDDKSGSLAHRMLFSQNPAAEPFLPEMKQPETWMGGFIKGLYDEFYRPVSSAQGMAGALLGIQGRGNLLRGVKEPIPDLANMRRAGKGATFMAPERGLGEPSMPYGPRGTPGGTKLLGPGDITKPTGLTGQPRFIAGEAGVAENRPYQMDIGPVNPRIGADQGTVLPPEYGNLVQIDPFYAASRGITLGRPIQPTDEDLSGLTPVIPKEPEGPLKPIGSEVAPTTELKPIESEQPKYEIIDGQFVRVDESLDDLEPQFSRRPDYPTPPEWATNFTSQQKDAYLKDLGEKIGQRYNLPLEELNFTQIQDTLPSGLRRLEPGKHGEIDNIFSSLPRTARTAIIRDYQKRIQNEFMNPSDDDPQFSTRPRKPRKYEDLTPDVYKRYSVYDENDNLFHTTYDRDEAHRFADENNGYVKDAGIKPGNNEPQFMQVPGPVNPKTGRPNIVMGGMSPRNLDVVGTAMYGNRGPESTVTELLQNLFDEHRSAGVTKAGKVILNHYDKLPTDQSESVSVTVKDYGRGLTEEQLYTIFTDVGETGKADDPLASGGFGFAKAAPMLSGKYFRVVTVVNEGGKKIEYTFEGTPAQLKAQKVGVPLSSREVPKGTPTGSIVKVWYPNDASGYNVPIKARLMTEGSPSITSDLIVTEHFGRSENDVNDFLNDVPYVPRSGQSEDYNTLRTRAKTYSKLPEQPKQDTIKIPGADIDIHYENNPTHTSGQYDLHILNKGLYQTSQEKGYGATLDNVPTSIVANVKATVEEGDESGDYPFTTSRENLNKKTIKAIKEWIDRNVVSGAQTRKLDILKATYNSMSSVPVQTSMRRPVLYDAGNRMTPAERSMFENHWLVQDSIEIFDQLMQDILDSVGLQTWNDRLEGVGVGIMPPSILGMHLPNPDRTNGDKSTIVINWFSSLLNHLDPESGAIESIATGLHEGGHIGREDSDEIISSGEIAPTHIRDTRVGKYMESYMKDIQDQGGKNAGHSEAWMKRLGLIYEKFGPERFYEAADRFQRLIEDPITGRYNAEVQRLLRIYQEASGRPETSEDVLSRTGVRSEPPRRGTGNLSGNDYPNGGGVVERLTHAISVAKPIREMQEELYTKERGRRIQAVERVKTKGLGGYYQQLGKLAGTLPKLELERFKLSPKDVDDLIDIISDAQITSWEKISAKGGLVKLLSGEVPQRSELALLTNAFGPEFGEQVMMHGGFLGPVPFTMLMRTSNEMKTMMASFDLSAPLRQGLPLALRKEYWKSLGTMIQVVSNKETFDSLMASIREDPLYIQSRDSGLMITDAAQLAGREEQFGGTLFSHRFPILKHIVAASERGYVGFLDKVRWDVYKDMVRQATIAGHDIGDGVHASDVTKQIAKFVNTASGRGSLGRFEKIAPELNAVLFSPRLISSRLTMLNPHYYVDPKLTPQVRTERLKSLFAIAAMGLMITGMEYLFSDRAEVETDPVSTDFMKLKIGNVRSDNFGGFQQYVVAAARLMSATRSLMPGQDVTNNPTIAQILARFGINKLSPMAGFIYAIASAKRDKYGQLKDQFGNDLNIPPAVFKQFTPLIIQDLQAIYAEDPSLLPLGLPAALGASTQVYDSAKSGTGQRLRIR